ncbi:MAG: hypothetical protein P8104_02150 [Gammaproteobacteria bacterium]
MRLRNIILVLFLLASPPGFAVGVGSPVELAKLSELIDLAKSRLREMRKSLNELQATNETLATAKDNLRNLQKEYEYTTNFDPERELQGLLGEANATDAGNRLYFLRDALYQRFTHRSSEDKDAILTIQKNRETLMATRDYYLTHGVDAEVASSEKDLSRVTASSTSIMAAEVLDRQVQALDREIQMQENRLREQQYQDNMLDFFRSH